ncbi:MAG: phytoene desaturase family protein [Candidatus Hodarchaeales archaeon]|jgi:prolycopene isomerase
MSKLDYDVIIIGAGLGGLTAASILSKNKRKVLVLEKNPVPGGYAVNFRRKGFEFDAGLHMMFGCKRDGLTYSILDLCGIAKKIKFLKPKYLYRTIFPDFDFRVEQCDIKSYIKLLQQMFPTEKNGIDSLFAEIKKIYDGIHKFDKFEVLSSEFLHSVNTTCNKLLNKHLNHPKLKAIIFQLWPYFGLPSNKLPIFYFCYPWYDFFTAGGFYPLGGAKTITRAFTESIIKNGGNILFNHEVKKIIIKDKIVRGVMVNKKNEFFGKIIISNLDARFTFENLIGDKNLPAGLLKGLNKLEPSISAFQVYLGLNTDLKKLGFFDYEVFVNPSYNLERQFNDSIKNNMSKMPYLLTCYSNLDGTCVPTKKSILVIATLSGYDFWEKLPIGEYKKTKEIMAQKLIKRAEDIIPHLSHYIEVQEVATPLTMKRYSGSCKGAIYGWAPSITQTGFRRMDFKTPIKNLYLVGAWTRPGGGTTGVMYSARVMTDKLLKHKHI